MLPGVTLPGLANVHVRTRATGRSETVQGRIGDLWTWREQMYASIAERLDPESTSNLAQASFEKMALSGVGRWWGFPLSVPRARRRA